LPSCAAERAEHDEHDQRLEHHAHLERGPRAAFVLARDADHRAVGCGALRPLVGQHHVGPHHVGPHHVGPHHVGPHHVGLHSNSDQREQVGAQSVADGQAVGRPAARVGRDLADETGESVAPDVTVAELKRMYARPGSGAGAALLSALEQRAVALGFGEVWLETRHVNQRAIAFYLRHGYRRIENYGGYIGRAECACLGKTLAPATAA
jgi:GNAT superfamily N-acetyltransferase